MKTKPRIVTTVGASVVREAPVKLSVNVSPEIGSRLRRLAFDERLSESSIVEVALGQLFAKIATDAGLGRFLREHGASLRRPTPRR
jgi:predicted transcriptional regulator